MDCCKNGTVDWIACAYRISVTVEELRSFQDEAVMRDPFQVANLWVLNFIHGGKGKAALRVSSTKGGPHFSFFCFGLGLFCCCLLVLYIKDSILYQADLKLTMCSRQALNSQESSCLLFPTHGLLTLLSRPCLPGLSTSHPLKSPPRKFGFR